MKLSLLAAAALVSASPIEKREVGGVLVCTGANATGVCEHRIYFMEECNQLQFPFMKNANTFALDGEDFTCFPRAVDCRTVCTSPTGCTLGAVTFAYEHKYNLSAVGGWNTLINSFDCRMNVHS